MNNLLGQMMEECRILNCTRTRDGFGGYTESWTDGASFYAAVAKKRVTEQQIAEKERMGESFTVVVEEHVSLNYHDVFRRIRDGAIFRVTSETRDTTAHPASTFRIAALTAERWAIS